MIIEKDRIFFEPEKDTEQDLERIVASNVGNVIHTPSNEEVAFFGGEDTWFTPWALPKMPNTSKTPFLFKDKEGSQIYSTYPYSLRGVGPFKFRSVQELYLVA